MIIEYNRQKAAAYALNWALSHNPNFYNFEDIGGDCTNYISQCLLAGNAKMNYNKHNGWFYVNSSSRSPSWTSVDFLQKFLLNNKTLGPFGKVVPLEKIEIGDIIQIRQNPNRFNHSVIVTKIENNEIYVCAHTYNVKNKRLSAYNFIELLPIHINGIYV